MFGRFHACLLTLAVLLLLLQLPPSLAAPKKKNYYEILEVAKDAPTKDIKRSYFKLSMKYHPDKNPDVKDKNMLEKHFSDLSHAYQVLSNSKTRERYDELLKQGVKVYTTADMQEDEKRAGQEEWMEEFKNSYQVFAEAELLSAEEERQQRTEKLTLLTMGLGIIGIGVWFAAKSRKLRKFFGFPIPSPSSIANVNNSKHLQAAIGQDREKQLAELEKLRLKEEKERAHAEKILDAVQRRRAEIAEDELAKEEAEREERDIQRELARLRRAQQLQDGNGENGDSSIASSDEGSISAITENMGFEASRHDFESEMHPNGEDDALYGETKRKGNKTAVFHCKPCKKSFKSEEQLENHIASKKHKQMEKEMEKAVAKN